MAQFAPVVPVHIAKALQAEERDYLKGYHLLLAHDIIDKPKDYQEIYGRVRRSYPDSFIILDNSIIELGKAMEIKDLLQAAAILKPNCIVIPDVMGDGDATRRSAMKFCREYVQNAYTTAKDVPPLMGVLQGYDVDDVLSTLGIFYAMPLVEYIGIPRVLTKMHGSRMPTLLAMQNSPIINNSHLGGGFKGFHLLGFSDNILDDVACCHVPWIQGIDSNTPVRAGMLGIPVDLNDGFEWSKKVGPRGEFWTKEFTGALEAGFTRDTQMSMICKNLDRYRGWVA